jgi:hypothetical protein
MRRAWLLYALMACAPLQAQEWPRVALPGDLRPFDIAREITHNGLPMRLQGFVSALPADRLVEQFRRSLGEPLVENRVGAQRVLGRMQGDFYVSVQIEPAGQGSRGTTAVTHLKVARDQEDAVRQQRERWSSRLLPGSRVLSQTVSRDGPRHATHLVFSNTHGEAQNREGLASLLQGEGLALEREGHPEGDAGRVLFFKGQGKEAMATLHRDGNGRTTVVLNVVARMENYR